MAGVEINEDLCATNDTDQVIKGLTWVQRIQGFAVLMSLALFSTLMSWFALGLGNYWKYCALSSLGSILSMLSTIIVMGPSAQLAYMFDEYRWTSSVLYVGSLFLTLFVALILQSVLLCLFCCVIQYAALLWYTLSYVPYGRDALVHFLLCQ